MRLNISCVRIIVSTLFISGFCLSLSAYAANEPGSPQATQDEVSIAHWLWKNNESEAQRLGLNNASELQRYLTIASVTTTEEEKPLTPSELLKTESILINSATSNSNSVTNSISQIFNLGDISHWVTLGKKAWEIIKNNQPVVNVTTNSISILPETVPSWRDMETWQGPVAKTYTIQAKNLYGATVISHTYTVAYYFGGSLNQRGRFLANATIIPTNVDVGWGFTLTSKVEVGTPLNTGTKNQPIPAVDLSLQWSMSSVLKKSQGTDQFTVRGDGSLIHTTGH